jgi:PBP1b-binding outer membrane lipoprotein LpoB
MKITALLLTTLVLSGCALKPTVESELIGQARPAVAVSEVVMLESTPEKFEKIAVLTAMSPARLTAADPQLTDELLASLKTQAAEVGANGLILTTLHDETKLVRRTGSYDGNQGYAITENRLQRVAQAVAIYIE